MTTLVCAVFFVSGASALVFETLWFYQAGLALGNSVWASSLVLAGFMAGLGLGNGLAALWGDRIRNPLLAYALLEAAIAVTGLGVVYGLPAAAPALAASLGTFDTIPWLLNPTRLAVSFAVLVIPSAAMGATLPLLTRALEARGARFGPTLGQLYGWNTLGAVCGVVLAEAWMVQTFGIRGSAWLAAATNAVAAIAIGISARGCVDRSPEASPLRLRSARPWLLAAFASGFCLLGLEVVWFRFLSLYIEGAALSFALMLAVVLASIALGGFAGALLLRRWPSAHEFAPLVALGAGFSCAGAYALSKHLAPGAEVGLLRDPRPILDLALVVMFPTSFASGIFFTLVGGSLRSELGTATRTTGVLTLANTMGSALGPLLVGFVLLPRLGMEASIFALCLVYGAVGVGLTLRANGPQVALAAAAGCGLLVASFPFGDMRQHHLRVPGERFLPAQYIRTLEVREGLTETIIYIERHLLDHHLSYTMLTNGHSMSATSPPSRRYMKLYAYMPVALHPRAESALLISYGVGSTAKALVDTESLSRIDVVDISRDILELSDIVYSEEEHPLRDPRVEVHIEDGRYFLQTTEQRFDLITGEPPPPRNAGVASLYSREYFDLMYQRLNPGGMVTYWLPLHELGEAGARSIVRAFCDSFANCSLWHGSGLDLMLAGTREAHGAVSATHFRAQWADAVVGPEMRDLGFERPEQMGALFVGDATYLKRLTRDDAPLVDDFPTRLLAGSSEAGHGALFESWLLDVDAARERFAASVWIRESWPTELVDAAAPYFEVQRWINNYAVPGRPPSIPTAHRALKEYGLRVPALWMMGSSVDVQNMLGRAEPGDLDHPLLQAHVGIGDLAAREPGAALASLERAEASERLRGDAFRLRMYALCAARLCDEAASLAHERYQRLTPGAALPPFWVWMAEEFGVDPRSAKALVQGTRRNGVEAVLERAE